MTLSHRIRRQDGFTLAELLVAIVIIGILAAVGYALFLGQDRKAMDAEAQSNARGLLGKVHTCFIATEDYTLCDEPAEQEPPPGVHWGSEPGEVEVVRGSETTRYRVTIRALSRATSDGANHQFTIIKDAQGQEERSCESDASDDDGGCNGGRW